MEQRKDKEPNPRREELKALSSALKAAARKAGVDYSMNELLVAHYQNKGCTDLRTFEQWKEEGYSVMKGQKSYPVWSRPVGTMKEKKESEKESQEDAFSNMFGICHLFDRVQVQKK